VIDTAKPKQGITDIRYIDPRKIRKVREVKKEKDPQTGVQFIKNINEYFIYDDKGISSKPGQYKSTTTLDDKALKISKDAISYCPSGLVDQDKNIPLSYLHKAIRPANQLRMMENAVVIYRITRAPERRIFYVDTGNLPKIKAEQYLKDIMDRYRNKLVYDGNTGEIRDDKKFMSMLEDYWMPRREGGRGTEIQTLPGGQNLGETGDVDYFQRKLYQALNVPVSRLEQQAGLNFGRSAEINRDELKFTKFIAKLRRRFSSLFDDLLKTQLILKGIITEDDWSDIRQDLKYHFASDAYYTESKEQEILRSRIEVLNGVAGYVGQFFSKEYVQKEILRMSDEDVARIDGEINSEAEAVEPQPEGETEQ
jgi:ferredoxin